MLPLTVANTLSGEPALPGVGGTNYYLGMSCRDFFGRRFFLFGRLSVLLRVRPPRDPNPVLAEILVPFGGVRA